MDLAASIIIPAFNRVDLTSQCLRALIQNTAGLRYEVIIVDNASTDATPQLCASLGGNATVIRNDENLGFAAACNQGARAANTDRLLFLNTDTEPFPNWLPPLLQVLEDEPDVGAVGMKLLFPDHTVQHAGVVLLELPEYPTLGAQHMPYKVSADDPLANQRRDVAVATAACLMVRRGAFEEVGGFDEGYWNGYEDVDLCLQLGAAGWRIVYEPQSVLIHHESSSGPERFRCSKENTDRLQERWAGKVTPDFVITGSEAVAHPDGVHARSLAGATS
jgi:GT2 family glycosyltransferase